MVIGTGAGGGVLGNELAQKGVSVVALEAGGRYLPEDYLNDEWDAFGQLLWLDPRTTRGDWRVAQDFSGLPAWIVKAVGGTTVHWAGASLRFQDHEWKGMTTYENPRDGVVNRWGQTHDVPNLFVSDGSVFTTGAAENPTLTIVARAIRQTDHIAAELGKGNI